MKRARKSKAAAPRDVELLDALNDEILAATGIKLAIMGEAHVTGFDSSALSEQCEQHIRRLREIMDRADA
jgi:hypothetical protein